MSPFPEGSKKNQRRKVARETKRTAGVKKATTRSARASTGSLAPWARSTARTMPERRVWSPTASTRISSAPSVGEVPQKTRESALTDTGMGSPVMEERSTRAWPRTTTPSAGIRSPAGTRTRSPGRRSRTDTLCHVPSDRRSARSGTRAAKAARASPVLLRARASSVRPSRITVITMPVVSK